ncbi:S16 family serine protease [Catenovulum maritimum]|uniref:S16 family serine protease n=1 Tax=Catenovulum maritimum TaxID=1513271 RepID=UPI00065FBC56|nr:S16 family serine protease [Catenovulum maritimum]
MSEIKLTQLEAKELSLLESLKNILTNTEDCDKQQQLSFTPKLAKLLCDCQSNSAKVYLLNVSSSPQYYLNWLSHNRQSKPLLNTEHLIGYFNKRARLARFVSGELFQTDKPFVLISASAILQDIKLVGLIGKILSSGKFDSRWLFNHADDKQHYKFQHKQLDFTQNIIFYGHSDSLYQLYSALPILNEVASQRVYESDYAVPVTKSNLTALKSFIEFSYQKSLSIKQLYAIAWALSRQLEDQAWLSLNLAYLEELLHSLPDNFDLSDVENSVADISGQNSLDKVLHHEQIAKGTVKVDFTGKVVGQINGLSVVETENAEFGEPSRITANIFSGEGDIGDIERKSDLGGDIHAKAMMIISSFVSKEFAENEPLSISSNIVFEQSYHGVDGDSASLAELYALLSAIAKVPINQNVAITGAIDQLGNVLAVGGVDLKIEGFYQLAQKMAPDETHHIIIPATNQAHLNLNSETIEAVKNKKLIIYPISHANQASSILTGLPAETENQDGLFDLVKESLLEFSEGEATRTSLFSRIGHIFHYFLSKNN